MRSLPSGGCRYWSTDTFFGDTADELYARHGDWVQRGLDTIAVELKAELLEKEAEPVKVARADNGK